MTQRPTKDQTTGSTKKSRPSKSRPNKSGTEADRAQRSVERQLIADQAPRQAKGLKRFFVSFVMLAALIAAFIFRSVKLGMKPPHFDEGINGYFVEKVWKDGFYTYDPSNFHGPLYFYFLQLTEVIFGRSIEAYRFANGLISLGCILLMAKHRRFLGSSVVWAVVTAALSTGFVFYSRYSIHETLFIFCQLLFTLGFFLYEEERSRKAALWMVLGFFGMMAVKETFLIFFVVWLIAMLILRVLKVAPIQPIEVERRGFFAQRATLNDWIVLITCGFFAEAFLFSGFFLHPQGFRDMFAAFAIWTKTGTGNSGHEKPIYYWLKLMWLYEWPVLVALAASSPLFFFVDRRKKLIILFALGTFAAYSLIPYKTPWLILNLLWPLMFICGFMLEKATLSRSFGLRWAARLAFVVLLIAMSKKMLWLNFEHYADPKEPYVYVQSTVGMKQVLDDVETRLKSFPEDLNMNVLVMVRDPWPLPWVFGEFPNLKYGKADDIDLTNLGVAIIDGINKDVFEKRLKAHVWRIPFQIRDSYEGGFAYLDFEKFKSIVPSDSTILNGDAAASTAVPEPAPEPARRESGEAK